MVDWGKHNGVTPFEKSALVFCVLVTVLSFLVALRFMVIEARIRRIETTLERVP